MFLGSNYFRSLCPAENNIQQFLGKYAIFLGKMCFYILQPQAENIYSFHRSPFINCKNSSENLFVDPGNIPQSMILSLFHHQACLLTKILKKYRKEELFIRKRTGSFVAIGIILSDCNTSMSRIERRCCLASSSYMTGRSHYVLYILKRRYAEKRIFSFSDKCF